MSQESNHYLVKLVTNNNVKPTLTFPLTLSGSKHPMNTCIANKSPTWAARLVCHYSWLI